MSDEVNQNEHLTKLNNLGRRITLAHIIAKPDSETYKKLGLNEEGKSLGIINIIPAEAAIIASDLAIKSAVISIDFVDRNNGSVIVSGDISSIDYAFQSVVKIMKDILQFEVCQISRS